MRHEQFVSKRAATADFGPSSGPAVFAPGVAAATVADGGCHPMPGHLEEMLAATEACTSGGRPKEGEISYPGGAAQRASPVETGVGCVGLAEPWSR